VTPEQAAAIEHCEFPKGYRPDANPGDCYFDAEIARKACEMGPRYFRHSRGRLGGKPLELESWQTNIIGTLWGWRRPDGTRRYRSCYCEVPRGNGKSTMVAIIAGLLLYLDDEPGAEVIGAAGSREQAREVFNVFKASVASSPALSRISKPYQNSVVRIDGRTGLDRGVYKVASAEAGTAHGGSAYGIIFDELHVQPNRDLWDVLESSKLKRDQPLTVAITTAGHDRGSICWEQHEYSENIINGSIDDNTHLPIIYAASVDDDWTDPETWKKANPNLGVSLKIEDMAAACNKAKTSPGYTNTFKRLHLNIWTELATLAIPMEEWDRCYPLEFGESPAQWRERAIENLKGEECYGGLDLASIVDVASFALWFPVARIVLPWFFVPRAAATKRGAEPGNRGRYEDWIGEGFINACPGVRIDQRMIRDRIYWANNTFAMKSISYDKWNAEALRIEIEASGIKVVEFGQTLANFTDPTKELIASVSEHSVDHGHNPVMRWMASNLSVYTDPNENMRPDKKHSADKIDGCVAWLMAWGEAISQSGGSGSIYDTYGSMLN
jgi:phage terminase large subunit-like protein